MKILMTISVLIIFIGCGDNKNKSTNELTSDTVSIHNVESKNNSAKESLIYSENLNFQLDDEVVITAGLEGNYSNPKFSPDGERVFFTNSNYSQIWMYDISQKEIQQISSLPGCGYKFSISNDGTKLYFRNKAARSKNQKGINTIIEQQIGTKNYSILYKTENSLTPPTVFSEQLFFSENDNIKCIVLNTRTFITSSNLPLIFTAENKLFKYKYGRVFNLNEMSADYIDVNYSIDGKYISCLTKTNGVEILNSEGNLINTFKEAVSLSILPNSNLVLFNKEFDDGHSIKKADLYLGFLNSQETVKLENENNEKRFQPSWSPTGNKIAYTTNKGVIKIVSFNIEKN